MSTYYKNQRSYPLATSTEHAVQLLNSNKVKAALIFDEQYKLPVNDIQDIQPNVVSQWWTSVEQPKKEFVSPGEVTYVVDSASVDALKRLGQQPRLLDRASVEAELKAAGLHMTPDALNQLHQKMLNAIAGFSNVFQEYMDIDSDEFVTRTWQIFAPKGALGRTPNLHIDHSVLSGLWYPYANRAPAQAYIGETSEQLWSALQPSKKGKSRGKASNKDRQNNMILRKFTADASPKDFMTFPDGALIVAKNLKGKSMPPSYRDLSDKKVRQSICLHKSGDVAKMGQVGLIMIPQIIRQNRFDG
jgi:hypothetical protein